MGGFKYASFAGFGKYCSPNATTRLFETNSQPGCYKYNIESSTILVMIWLMQLPVKLEYLSLKIG